MNFLQLFCLKFYIQIIGKEKAVICNPLLGLTHCPLNAPNDSLMTSATTL